MGTQLIKTHKRTVMQLVLAVAILSLSPMSFAQEETTNGAQTSDDAISLNFRDADLQQLVDVVSRATGKVFILDRNVQGQVTVVSGSDLAPDQLYDVFLSILDINGFAAVPSGNITKIVRKDLVRASTTPTVFNTEERSSDEQITRVFTFEHASPGDIAPVIQPLLPSTSVLQIHNATNSMIVSDSAGNISRIESIIERLDRPSATDDVIVVRLKHASASKLAPLINGTIAFQGGQNGQRATAQPDTTLNALILTGDESRIAIAQALIAELDVPLEGGEVGAIRVFRLKYAKATELVPIIDSILQVGSGKSGSEAQTLDPQTGQVVAYNPSNSAGSSGLNADEATNTIIVRGTPELFADIEAVISYLDVRRPQVLVEAVIAEVTESKESQLGVSWQGVNNRLETGELDGSFGAPAGDSFGGLSVGYISQRIFGLATEGLVPDLRIVVDALRSDSESNIVATPNILTLNNNEAEIVVGQEIPVLVGRRENDDGSETYDVERKTVGLKLKITPQINDGNSILLDIEQEISSLLPTVNDNLIDVATSERTINTLVEAQNGQVIVLGGLVQDDTTGTDSKVPGLGDLPIFGNLFRSRTKNGSKTNLMVFIRPVVVENPVVMADLTDQRYNNVRESQKDSLQDLRYLLPSKRPAILPELEEFQTGTRLPLDYNRL